MNDFTNHPHASDFDAPGGDPLDRLVEAFVDLSVPEGPDAATQRALVARLVAPPVERVTLPAPRREFARTWSFVMQTLATAALVAIAATAVIALLRRDPRKDNSAEPEPQQLVAAPSSSVDAAAAVVGSGDLKELLDFYLQARTRLAQSQRWQQAHERLSSALERPEVIGVGVGLLGAVPWASYARF